jgi:hypothetical protein
MMSYLNQIQKAGTGETKLKVLLTGESDTGKSTSVIFGAPKPLLVIDLEKGTDQYAKVSPFSIFPSEDPRDIVGLAMELKDLKKSGQEVPFKSVFIDSGTVLYKSIMQQVIQSFRDSGSPNKQSLEPSEYDIPKNIFYGIIRNLMAAGVHLFVSAHASDNYIKGTFMKVDPNEPIKPDCEKRLTHEMDVHLMFKKLGTKRHVQIKKSRLVDKQGNNLLPAEIKNYDNSKLIPEILEMANKDRGYEQEKPGHQVMDTEQAQTDELRSRIISLVGLLGMSNEDAHKMLYDVTKKNDLYKLTAQELEKVAEHLQLSVDKAEG